MDFGKLPCVDKVNFSFPPEPERNHAVLAAANDTPLPPGIYVGPTGYNMKQWVGKWYPFGAREKDFLKYYGQQFNTIEFNTTHYKMPDAASIERWTTEAPADFRYCPKIPQSISHSRDLGLSGREPFEFCRVISGLGERLGYCFMQLPPHFGPRELPLLDRFLSQTAHQIPMALEARHPVFFQSGPESKYYFDLLRQYQAVAVITDVAGRRDVCHMVLTHPVVLIRFVGNGLHPTDYTRVKAWSERLKYWFDQGLKQVYFFAHEPDNLLAPELSLFCVETFRKAIPGIPLRGPTEVPGRQGSLF